MITPPQQQGRHLVASGRVASLAGERWLITAAVMLATSMRALDAREKDGKRSQFVQPEPEHRCGSRHS
jgi:hypothetical protein